MAHPSTIATCSALMMAGQVVASVNSEAVHFGCDDLVVIGQITDNEGYLPDGNSDDDIFGYVTIAAKLNVQKRLQGPKTRSKLRVTYFGHTYYREHLKMMFVLRRNGDDSFSITSAHVMKPGPKLADSCTPTPNQPSLRHPREGGGPSPEQSVYAASQLEN